MERNMTVIAVCPFCSSSHSVDVNSDDYIRWMDGVNAQDAFPYLNNNEREAILSGICPICCDKTFKDFDEDEEDFEDWEDDVDECGYNPYMGCYDFDC